MYMNIYKSFVPLMVRMKVFAFLAKNKINKLSVIAKTCVRKHGAVDYNRIICHLEYDIASLSCTVCFVFVYTHAYR